MKKGLYMQDINSNEQTKTIKNTLLMYILGIIIIFVLIIAIIIVLSINIQAMTQEPKTEQISVTGNIEENRNTEKENEEVLIVSKGEEVEKDVSIIEDNGNSNSQNTIYTAPNGEKYSIIATLNIPTLGIEYPILSTTSAALLKISLNKYWGADPNEVGNMCIVGHNYLNTKFFSKLPNIKMGDIVKITDLSNKTLEYKVYDTYTVDPDDTSCTSQLTDGHTEITLITCYNDKTERFIVKARAM